MHECSDDGVFYFPRANEMTGPEPERRGRSIAWVLASATSAVAVAFASFFFLYALTGPFGIGLVVIVVILFAFVGLHYVVWGRWLGPMISADSEADSSDTEAQPPTEHDLGESGRER